MQPKSSPGLLATHALEPTRHRAAVRLSSVGDSAPRVAALAQNMEGCLFLSLGRPRFGGHAPEDSLQALAAWRREVLEYGPSTAASRAAGDFAVGLREPGGRTFLAVDRFAQQSLCYRIAGGRLEFAERADDLVGPRPEIDPQAIFDYLYFHCIPSPRTIFAGVPRLPPGHCAVFENGQLTVARYWTPSFGTPAAHSLDALGEEFRQLLEQSVHRQLDGTKPACFLSGGTDSSTVAGMIGQVSGRPAATYSIGFDAEGYDEMAYARIAARHFGTEHHEYYVTPDDLVRSIADVAAFIRPAVRQFVGAARVLLRALGARRRRQPPARRRRRRRALRRQLALCQAAGLRLVR